jgi:hypothetical protein
MAPRDPFAAFLCDEASLDLLRPMVAEMGWAPENARAAACAARSSRWPSVQAPTS